MKLTIEHDFERSGGDYAIKNVILEVGETTDHTGFFFVKMIVPEEPENLTWKKIGARIEARLQELGKKAIR